MARPALLLGVLSTVACTPAFQSRLPGRAPVSSRLVAMPVIASATEVDAFGKRTPMAEWAEAMADNAEPEVTRLIQLHGGFDLPLENVKACGQPCASLFVSLIRWGAVASMEIAAQMRGRANFRMYSVGDWQAKRDYAPLRQAIGADYALFVQLRDIWDTTGAAVAKLFAGMHSYFRQVGVACVVSLIDGRMIWCYAESDGWGDLRTAPAAQALVRRLLADLWSPPAAAQE